MKLPSPLTAEGLAALARNPDLARAFVDRDGTTPVEDGAALLDDVASFIGRYVVCNNEGRDAVALWTVHTWAVDAADCTPRLALLSAEPQSGKTRMLEALKLLVRAPLFAVNVSEAALFRVVAARQPTVLHDEIDAVFGPKARDREDLRAMLNAGYERGAEVQRCVGDGSRQRVEAFPVFTPVALAGLGQLPETVEQRSIVLRMKRRAPGETVAKLRRRQVGPEAERLRARLEAWAAAHVDRLAGAEPEVPDELDDRAGDVWEPLLAIADEAGGTWPERARAAAVALFAARRTDEASIGVRLLADIRAVFDDPAVAKLHDDEKGDGLPSGDLAAALATIEGSPWAEWSGRDRERPLSAHGLARLLRRYDIVPRQHKMGGTKMRGYLRADFADAWLRLLPPQSGTGDEVVPLLPSNGEGGTTLTPVPLCGGEERPGDDGELVVPDLEAVRLVGAEAARVVRGRDLGDDLGAEDCGDPPHPRVVVAADDPDRGFKVAQARAAEVRRRRADSHRDDEELF